MNINEDAIEELTKMLIKEDFKSKANGKEYVTMTKQELIRFCIKLIKTIENYR